MGEPSREVIVAGLMAYGSTREDAERAADRKLGVKPRNMRGISDAASDPQTRPTYALLTAEQSDPGISAPIRGTRTGDLLWLEIVTPPRTKKNHAASLGSQKSPMYKRYLAEIIEAIAVVHDRLALPLPDRRPLGYNCRVCFYVDKWGERADRTGLEQGLHDALQAAGVVTDDWVFRRGDGTRIVAGQRPRVEIWISPISPSEL